MPLDAYERGLSRYMGNLETEATGGHRGWPVVPGFVGLSGKRRLVELGTT